MNKQGASNSSAAVRSHPAALYALPASPMQQRLWGLSNDGASDPAWNVAVRFRLTGRLSVERFQQAIDSVLARHEILRCSLGISGDSSGAGDSSGVEVQQFVRDLQTLPLQYFDLSVSRDPDYDLDALSRSHAESPFDLSHAPLLRIGIVQLKPNEHVLLITAHHAILDGLSVGLLSDALMAAYASGSVPAQGDDLQFADYAVWFKERQQTEEYKQHGVYWGNALKGVGVAEFPKTRKLPSAEKVANHIESILLPRSITDQLQQMAKDGNATFFHVVLAAFACAMRAETNHGEMSIGIPVTGRDQPEIERVIGPMVNYLPLRISVADSARFGDLIETVADLASDALSHGEYRFEDMLRSISPVDQRLFNAVFICQRDFVQPREAGGVTLTAMPSVSPGALHDLTVFMVERADGWRLSCEIDVARQMPEFARQFLGRYQRLLRAVGSGRGEVADMLRSSGWELQPLQATQPPVSTQAAGTAIPEPVEVFYPASEAQQRYWDLDRIDPGNSKLHLRIRYAITGRIDLEAFRTALEILTARHEALRTTFQVSGDGLVQRVSPSIELPFQQVSLPSGPACQQQLEEILRVEGGLAFDLENGPLWHAMLATTSDTSAVFAVTLAHIIGDGWSCGVLTRQLMEVYGGLISGPPPSLEPSPMQFGPFAATEQDAAHQQEITRRLTHWDKLLTEPFPSLNLPADKHGEAAAGGAVFAAVIDPSLAMSVRQLARENEVTVYNVYSSAFNILIHRYTGVDRIALSTPVANRTPGTEDIIGPFADAVLVPAGVGETFEQSIRISQETMLDVFENAVSLQRLADRLRTVSIQLSFLYQEAFVKDIEAAGLLLENMPNRATEAVFDWQLSVVDRNGDVTGELLYDASLFSQETARLVMEHYQRLLSQCVVAPRRRFATFSFATEAERRAAAAKQDLLPVSRRALGLAEPASAAVVQDRNKAMVAPRSADEERMSSIWQQAFGIPAISVEANFFDLGGRSLLLARMQVAIEKEFGKRIFTADIFAAPTIATLTRRITTDTQGQPGKASTRIIPIQPNGTQTPIFVISQSMIFRGLATRLGPDQPMFTIQILDEDVAEWGEKTTFQELAALYVSYLRLAQHKGPYRIGGWCVSSWIAYEMAQQLTASGEEVEMLVLVDAYAPGYWRDLAGMKRVLAKSSYYASRTRYYTQLFAKHHEGDSAGFAKEFMQAALHQAAYLLGERSVTPQPADEHKEALVELVVDAASGAYTAVPYFDPRFLVFRSEEQPVGGFLPIDMGWGKLLQTPVNVILVPGDHKEMFAGPGAAIMAEHISRSLLQRPSAVDAS